MKIEGLLHGDGGLDYNKNKRFSFLKEISCCRIAVRYILFDSCVVVLTDRISYLLGLINTVCVQFCLSCGGNGLTIVEILGRELLWLGWSRRRQLAYIALEEFLQMIRFVFLALRL